MGFLDEMQNKGVSQSPFEKAMSGEVDDGMLRQSIAASDSIGLSPDEVVESKNLSSTLGLPQQVVASQLPEARKRAEGMSLIEAAKKDPALAELIQDPHALSVVKDDVGALTRVADVARSIPGGLVNAVGSVVSGTVSTYDIVNRNVNKITDQIKPDSMKAVEEAAKYFMNPNNIGRLWSYLSGINTKTPELKTIGQDLQEIGRQIKDAGSFIDVPQERQTFFTEVGNATGQIIGQIGAALIAGPEVAATMMFPQGVDAVGDSVKKFGKQETVGGDAAQLLGGAITSVTEKYGISLLLDRVPPAIKNKVIQWIADVALAGAGEASQEVAENVLQNTAVKFLVDDKQAIMEGVPEAAGVADVAGMIARTAIRSLAGGHARAKVNAADARAQQADATISSLETLRAAGEATKTSQRDPQTYSDFMRKLAERTGVEKVFVSAEKVIEYFQSQNIDPYESGIVNPEELSIAAGHGTDVGIPLENFMTKIDRAGFDALVPHAKYSEDAWSASDAESFRSNIDSVAREYGEDFIADMNRELVAAAPVERIYNDIKDKMIASGRPSYQADRTATYARAWYRSMGERLSKAGLVKDAMDLYERFPINVQGERVLEPKQIEQLDFDIAALRQRSIDNQKSLSDYKKAEERRRAKHEAKQAEMFPTNPEMRKKYVGRTYSNRTETPILDEIRRMGGVRPDGKFAAELKAMGITPKTHRSLFNKESKNGDFDNIPKGEGRIFDYLPDEAGYIDRNALLEAIRDEQFGKLPPDYVSKITERDKYLDDLERYIGELGLDFATDDAAKIKEAINADQRRRSGEELPEEEGSMYQLESDREAAGKTPYTGDTIEIDGVQRTTKNSEGRQIAQTEEGLRAFWAWFGDSMVVDADGRPLVVYHGSGTTIDEFKYEFTGQGNDKSGSGFYFTTDKSQASGYTERRLGGEPKLGGDDNPSIVEGYLSIKNPVDSNAIGSVSEKQIRKMLKYAPKEAYEEGLGNWGDPSSQSKASILNEAVPNYAFDEENVVQGLFGLANDFFGPKEGVKAFNNAMRDVLGYDGVISYNQGAPETVHYIAFSPTQIKSVFNRGTFDPNDPRILYQKNEVPQNIEELQGLLVSREYGGVETSMYEQANGDVYIGRIEVDEDKQRQGYGTKSMEEIVRYADVKGVRVFLSPSTEFGASSVARLKKFYKHHH